MISILTSEKDEKMTPRIPSISRMPINHKPGCLQQHSSTTTAAISCLTLCSSTTWNKTAIKRGWIHDVIEDLHKLWYSLNYGSLVTAGLDNLEKELHIARYILLVRNSLSYIMIPFCSGRIPHSSSGEIILLRADLPKSGLGLLRSPEPTPNPLYLWS